LRVFNKREAIVIGPTPPGTGVIKDAFLDTVSKSTSPDSLKPDFLDESATRVVPTSTTIAFSFIKYSQNI
jgi:hypothetical protein